MVPAGPERPALLADPGVRADVRLEDGKTVRGSSQLCGSPRIVDHGEGKKKKKQHCFGNLLLSVTEGRRPLIPFLGVQFL